MSSQSLRLPAGMALLASVLGFTFAAYSTFDYAAHLDRGVHDLHCSLIPGMPVSASSEACRAAMYSPYSAVFRTSLWGGVPISLFALGAFAFFACFSLYLLAKDEQAPRRARDFFGLVSLTPTLVSLVMFVLAVTKVGELCRVCVGIYLASLLLSASGILVMIGARAGKSRGSDLGFHALALVALGVSTLLPAATYAATAPDHEKFLRSCGTLKNAPTKSEELLPMKGAEAKREALFFEDPLCPTCKAFHSRLVTEDIVEKLDASVVLFPLDSECNWMLSEPLHPGACLLSRAILCADDARAALDWAFENQTALADAGKSGPKALETKIGERFGGKVTACMHSRQAKQRLNKHLHFAAENNVPVSTPQMYLGTDRVCDEDTDIGLSYTLKKLAPELVP